MSLPTSERLFPPPTTRNDECRETLVLWVIEEEPIPSSNEFWSIYESIQSALYKEGYHGKTSLQGFVVNPNKELPQEYWDDYEDYGITIYLDPEGDEGMRYNKMLLHIIFWAFTVSFAYANTSNLLVLSRNKNFGQDTKFYGLCETLEKRGIHVAVAHPDTLKNFDGIDQSPSSHTDLPIGGISVCCSDDD